MVKRPEGAFHNFYAWAMDTDPCFVPCFSLFTLIELRRSPPLFADFIERFAPFPCVMLKSYDWLLEEEVKAYPEPSSVDPCGLAFTPLGGDGNLLNNLPTLLQDPTIVQREEGWNQAGPGIVEGMLSLVPNFQPEGDKYSAAEVRLFIQLAGWQQLALRARPFFERTLDGGAAVELDAFPSLKTSLYTTFHKFYADRNRKPSDSDAFDIIISSEVPYVEAVITENHQAEVLRKTAQNDRFISTVKVFRLSDFIKAPPKREAA
jgi:hypothetical protein